MTLLSVVIPNFNDAEYIGGAIASCLRSGDAADEVVVVDDGSTDRSVATLAALQEADARIKVLHHETNRGPVAALNSGLAAARGEWILFRAANDLCAPGSMAAFRELRSRFPDAGVITGDPSFFDGRCEDAVRQPLGRASQAVEVTVENYLDRYGANLLHGPFCRADWLREAGGLDEALRWHCDWFLFMRLALMRGFVYVPRVISHNRLDARSYNAAGTAHDGLQRRVLERLVSLLDDDDDLRARMLACGCLDFFGEPLRELLRGGSAERRQRFAAVLQEPSAEVRAARRATGVAATLRHVLASHASRIGQHSGDLAILGAGGHTRQMLAVWRELNLPQPSAVLVTAATTAIEAIEGIPVRSIDALQHLTAPLVVLSSQSYEPLLASTMERKFPDVPVVRVWTQAIPHS